MELFFIDTLRSRKRKTTWNLKRYRLIFKKSGNVLSDHVLHDVPYWRIKRIKLKIIWFCIDISFLNYCFPKKSLKQKINLQKSKDFPQSANTGQISYMQKYV